MSIWKGIVPLLLALFLASSMFVDTDEVAIVYRFGAANRVASSGLSFRFPYPVEWDERLPISEVRIADIGRMRLLTGDVNLVEAWPIAQYTISDPIAFATRYEDPDKLLKSIIEIAITTSISHRAVDKESFINRNHVQQETQRAAQKHLNRLQSGIRLDSIEIKELAPPSAVADAFNEVSSARGDKDTMILSAQSYASKILPDIRGKSAERKEKADAEAERIRSESIAKVDRFQALLPQWRANSSAIRERLKSQFWQELHKDVEVGVLPVGSNVVIKKE